MYTLNLYPGLLPNVSMPNEAFMPKPETEFDKLAKNLINAE